MFTATAPSYQCSVCHLLLAAYKSAARYYNNQYNFSLAAPDHRLVFFVAEVDDARSVVTELNFDTVPRVYLLPPRNQSSPRLKFTDHEVPMAALKAESLTSFFEEIKKKSGITVYIDHYVHP